MKLSVLRAPDGSSYSVNRGLIWPVDKISKFMEPTAEVQKPSSNDMLASAHTFVLPILEKNAIASSAAHTFVGPFKVA